MADKQQRQSVGMIGLGQMARALARGWQSRLAVPPRLIGFDPVLAAREAMRAQLPEFQIAADNPSVVREAETVVLAVKPHLVRDVCAEIKPATAQANPLVISIAAGVTLSQLADWLGSDRVVRVMPNTPCLVGEGAAGFAVAGGVSERDTDLVEQLLAAVGISFQLPERLLDAVTGLSGSGPAYVFVMLEALADGGVKMGLPRNVAQALATQTMLGAAKLLQEEQVHPGVLKDRVASPGGTTIAGLAVLERSGIRAGLIDAVVAAAQRASELSES